MVMKYSLLLSVAFLLGCGYSSEIEDPNKKISDAIEATMKAISGIENEWEIMKYPSFLKNCHMPKLSWDMMRSKFEQKILSYLSSGTAQQFVMSFTGSSVTAGHDSFFSQSYPVLIESIMKPALAAIGVTAISRNLALGNNPCIPYNACVKYFCGYDADLVLWEQSYNCRMEQSIVEQFIRQAMTIPEKPIVVFTESPTGTWKEAQCEGVNTNETIELNKEEVVLYKLDRKILTTQHNDGSKFRGIANFIHAYKSAGIQTFHFSINPKYQCKGPFIPSWQKGAASWHPSVSGHKYRAAVHSYFWLHIWMDALRSVLDGLKSEKPTHALKTTIEFIKQYESPLPPASRASPFPDDLVCKTDYEPRTVREASLKDQVVSGLRKEGSSETTGWGFALYEDLVNKGMFLKSQRMGYKDYKYVIYGNEASGPLSFKFEMSKLGPLFVCQTPGIWGKLPKNFVNIWEDKIKAFITYDVQDPNNFLFKKEKSAETSIFWVKQDLQICVQIQSKDKKDNKNIKSGKHVLTIVPKGDTSILFAWLLTV